MDVRDSIEIEQQVAPLKPKHPDAHTSGLLGVGAALCALAVFWIGTSLGLPGLVAAPLALVSAYLMSRQHSNAVWTPYRVERHRLIMERVRKDNA